jgi:hypothetical protein
MEKNKRASRAVGLLACAGAVAVSAPALAQDAGLVACDTYENPVIISGASSAKTVVQALATVFKASGVPISIIYASPDSCLGLGDLETGGNGYESNSAYVPGAAAGATSFPPMPACGLQTGDAVDIAISDVFAATCAASTAGVSATGLTDIYGPIQAVTFAVPQVTGAPTVISAAAAQVVFAYDAAGYTVAPWTVPNNILTRESSSGALNMAGVAINLSPSLWANSQKGAPTPPQYTSATSEASALANITANPSQAIAIVAAENIPAANAVSTNNKIQALAYQHTSQSCGYLPDSSSTAFDKINVRQGRYAIWGPIHFLINGTAPTGPHAAAVATVLNYLIATGNNPDATPFSGAIGGDAGTGVSAAEAQYLITEEAKPGYVIPWCAMEAQRATEIGPESSYASPDPCSCLYETTVGSVVNGHTCTACSSTSPCATGTCRYGYCEAY